MFETFFKFLFRDTSVVLVFISQNVFFLRRILRQWVGGRKKTSQWAGSGKRERETHSFWERFCRKIGPQTAGSSDGSAKIFFSEFLCFAEFFEIPPSPPAVINTRRSGPVPGGIRWLPVGHVFRKVLRSRLHDYPGIEWPGRLYRYRGDGILRFVRPPGLDAQTKRCCT